MGGKILNLVDKAADRNVLWRNPRVPVRPGPLQATVDDYFAGGWDDAFPTGDPCVNEHGDELPYMGEVWNLPLGARVERAGPSEAIVVLDGYTPITPARWTRTLRLSEDKPVLRLHTRIENVGYVPLSFCWGSHPALAVHDGIRLEVPARRWGRSPTRGRAGRSASWARRTRTLDSALARTRSSTSAECPRLPWRATRCMPSPSSPRAGWRPRTHAGAGDSESRSTNPFTAACGSGWPTADSVAGTTRCSSHGPRRRRRSPKLEQRARRRPWRRGRCWRAGWLPSSTAA